MLRKRVNETFCCILGKSRSYILFCLTFVAEASEVNTPDFFLCLHYCEALGSTRNNV